MSATNHLAHLEAQAWANTQKIDDVSNQKHKLTTENARQGELIPRYEQDLDLADANASTLSLPPASRAHQERFTDRLFSPPGPLPTPFFVAAREASQVQLAFMIPGYKGETLEVAVHNVDLAFVLEQTLKRRGWGDLMVRKGIDDFLERPMVKVRWRGREGEFGALA